MITIPRDEVAKFKEDDNKLYKDLLGCINGKMLDIVQKEQKRRIEKKSKTKSKGSKYYTYQTNYVKFSCKLEEKKTRYCFVEDLCDKSDPEPSFNDCVVSPLCLSVYAVSKGGTLPFLLNNGETSNDNTNNSRKKRKKT